MVDPRMRRLIDLLVKPLDPENRRVSSGRGSIPKYGRHNRRP